jgi:hypothetical protein
MGMTVKCAKLWPRGKKREPQNFRIGRIEGRTEIGITYMSVQKRIDNPGAAAISK